MKPISTSTPVGSSLLLWALAALVAILVMHVALGWMREAQRAQGVSPIPGPNPAAGNNYPIAWWPMLLSALVLGTGLCTVIVLGLSSEALGFTVGYRLLWAPALWVAAAAMAVQTGWIVAAGFRPGVVWRPAFLVTAGVLMLIGFWSSFSMANSLAAHDGRQRRMWRLAADGLGGLTLIGGQEIVTNSARLLTQAGSVYQRELSANILSLALGAVVPIVLAMLAMDLSMRRSLLRRNRRDAGNRLADDRPRRKRRRYRQRSI
jgi:hypothetical protein